MTWAAITAGCVQQQGMGHGALNIYSVMRNEGVTVPGAATYVCLVQAYASVGTLQRDTVLPLRNP